VSIEIFTVGTCTYTTVGGALFLKLIVTPLLGAAL